MNKPAREVPSPFMRMDESAKGEEQRREVLLIRAGDQVNLADSTHPYKDALGMVGKMNWRDSSLVWVIFKNWHRDQARRKALSPRWWPISSLTVVNHDDLLVDADFQAVLEELVRRNINFPQLRMLIEELWGLDLPEEDIKVMFTLSDEQQASHLAEEVPPPPQRENSLSANSQ